MWNSCGIPTLVRWSHSARGALWRAVLVCSGPERLNTRSTGPLAAVLARRSLAPGSLCPLDRNVPLPLDAFPPEFAAHIRGLEAAYLWETDPIRQSGLSGGADRWRSEREPILSPVTRDGSFLDLCCANGFLLECLVDWAAERSVELIPHGADIGASLIDLARRRHPKHEQNFHVANAFDWEPSLRYRYAYTLHDCVPSECFSTFARRSLRRYVESGGYLIVGAYGSRSRGVLPADVSALLRLADLPVAGEASVGSPVVATFAWVAA